MALRFRYEARRRTFPAQQEIEKGDGWEYMNPI